MNSIRTKRGRRLAVTAIAVVASATLLVGCSGSGANDSGSGKGTSSSPVTLHMWSWGVFQKEAAKIWNEKNPDIQVEIDKIPAGNSGGYAKMHAAAKAGNAPDLGTVEFQTFPSFMMNDELLDLTPYLTKKQINAYVPWMYAQGVVDDHVYSLPYGSGPMALFYRTDLFKAAGLEVPKTWAEFAKAAEVIHANDPQKYITAFDPGSAAISAAYAWQAGAQWFGTKNGSWTVNLTGESTNKVADYWQDLVERGLVKVAATFSDSWYKDLQDGNLAAWLAPSWGGVTLETQAPDTAGKWAIADIPQWGEGKFVSSNWGGSGAVVFKGSKHPEEAAKFAAWLGGSDIAANLGAKALNWPAVSDVSNLSNVSAPLEFFGGQTLESVFEKSATHVDTSWKWVPNFDVTANTLSDGLKEAISEKGSFREAFAKAQAKTISDLKGLGLKAEAGN